MIYIPAGKGTVGTTRADIEALAERYHFHPSWLDGEAPTREVTIRSYFIEEFPVTCADFIEFCEATQYAWPLLKQNTRHLSTVGRMPVTGVSLADAEAYAHWLGRRLPTEREWEYAARGPQSLTYPWGHEWNPRLCNSNDQNAAGGRGRTPVDAYPDGKSPFGVMDMVGNVCEWTSSSYRSHDIAVVRGGFFKQHEPYRFRPACRLMSQSAGNRLDYVGFRCALDGKLRG